MRKFLLPLFVSALALGAAAPVGLAQSQPAQPQPIPQRPAEPARPTPPRQTPDAADERPQSRVDRLFQRLKAAKDASEAKGISDQIQRIWARSGSDTLDLLMGRVDEATKGNDAVLALDLLDSIIALRPDWAEAFAKRARIHVQRKDFDGAMRDLRLVLVMEPRHYLALAGVGMVFQQAGQDKRALEAFEEALKLHPHLPGIRTIVERLRVTHGAQGI
jgi:tetratricopeptide (TPR) repeat protein